jgi:hypothetical protein
MFTTAVKTDSQNKIITGPQSDPVKNIIGPESAGERGGMQRFTKVMFGAGYIDGRPDPGTRIDPNNPAVKSGICIIHRPSKTAPASPKQREQKRGNRRQCVTNPCTEDHFVHSPGLIFVAFAVRAKHSLEYVTRFPFLSVPHTVLALALSQRRLISSLAHFDNVIAAFSFSLGAWLTESPASPVLVRTRFRRHHPKLIALAFRTPSG